MLQLNTIKKTQYRLPRRVLVPLSIPDQANHTWSMDFMSDSTSGGVSIRTLNIIDDYNRKVLHIDIARSIPAYRVIEQLSLLIHEYGKPQRIRVDNGPEFTSTTFVDWCNKQKIMIHYIQPGKPMQNGFIERFNRSYRTEVLDAHLFHSLADAKKVTSQWIDYYNNQRPHDSLKGVPPSKYQASKVVSSQ